MNEWMQFLTPQMTWSCEYPDAKIFDTLREARSVAEKVPLANIIIRFGYEDQLCIETWRDGYPVTTRKAVAS